MCIGFWTNACCMFVWGNCFPWNWSHRQLWAAMWMLGIELRSLGKAVGALNYWAIFPAPIVYFLRVLIYLLNGFKLKGEIHVIFPPLSSLPPSVNVTYALCNEARATWNGATKLITAHHEVQFSLGLLRLHFTQSALWSPSSLIRTPVYEHVFKYSHASFQIAVQFQKLFYIFYKWKIFKCIWKVFSSRFYSLLMWIL